MPRREISERHLIPAAFAPSTLDKYHRAVTLFLAWCHENNEDCDSADQMDSLLTDFAHDLYDDGGSKHLATCALYGVLMYLPQYKTALPLTRLTLKGWNRKHPPVPYPPLPWNLTVTIAARFRTHVSPVFAIAVLLAFDCFLRLGELLALRKNDVSNPARIARNNPLSQVYLRLRKTKTGPNKSVVLRNPQVQALLLQLVRRTPGGEDRLFPMAASTFRQHFRQACIDLGMVANYVPHSLRHGSATQAFMEDMPIEDILARGRWASTKSARHYVQTGRALLLAHRNPPRLAELGDALSASLLSAFSLPQSH
jgi:integrase